MSIRVNADYESELFFGQTKGIVNQALEFLAFFASDETLFTQTKFSPEYLSYVESLSGRKPRTTSTGEFRNWWGPLVNIPLERKLNSKLTSAELNLTQGWCSQTQIIHDQTPPRIGGHFIVKDPFGMSGQGLSKNEIKGSPPYIIEPLFDRVYDFSRYFFPDGKAITYQNFVDQKFQYRGTLIHENQLHDVPEVDWPAYERVISEIRNHYFQNNWPTGFSVDSFIYREQEQFKIRYLCEVNYRRTMGSTTYEIAEKLKAKPWRLMILGKGEVKDLKEKDIIKLSPDNVRFHIFFLHAENHAEGVVLLRKLKTLLPNSQFTIDL